jgi:hypothetical protein
MREVRSDLKAENLLPNRNREVPFAGLFAIENAAADVFQFVGLASGQLSCKGVRTTPSCLFCCRPSGLLKERIACRRAAKRSKKKVTAWMADAECSKEMDGILEMDRKRREVHRRAVAWLLRGRRRRSMTHFRIRMWCLSHSYTSCHSTFELCLSVQLLVFKCH